MSFTIETPSRAQWLQALRTALMIILLSVIGFWVLRSYTKDAINYGVKIGVNSCRPTQQTGVLLPQGVIEGIALEDSAYRYRDRAQ